MLEMFCYMANPFINPFMVYFGNDMENHLSGITAVEADLERHRERIEQAAQEELEKQ